MSSVDDYATLASAAMSRQRGPRARRIGGARTKVRAIRGARIAVVAGDILPAFVRRVALSTPRHITVVSPWLSEPRAHTALAELLSQARRHRAQLVVITRRPTTESHHLGIEALKNTPRSTVMFNERLHAKVYVCELRGGGAFCLVGSANMTRSAGRLDEVGLLLLIPSGTDTAREILRAATGSSRAVRLTTSAREEYA